MNGAQCISHLPGGGLRQKSLAASERLFLQLAVG